MTSGNISASASLQPQLAEDATAHSTRPDGNNVEIESELLAMNTQLGRVRLPDAGRLEQPEAAQGRHHRQPVLTRRTPMNIISGIDVTAGALDAQKTRMDIVAQNIANAETTRTPAGGPYQRQVVSFESELVRQQGAAGPALQTVKVSSITSGPVARPAGLQSAAPRRGSRRNGDHGRT